MHLCAELTAAFWTLEPFGEIGANFSLQLSSQTWFNKIIKKKVIAENQCKKHKKIEYECQISCLNAFRVMERHTPLPLPSDLEKSCHEHKF